MYRIETPNLLLRPFEESDFDAVHAYASDPNATRYMWWGPNSEVDTRSFIRRAIEVMRSPDSGENEFAIVERASSRLLGACGLNTPGRQSRVFEIGYLLSSDFWRRGYGSEAVEHLMAFGFDSLDAHRIFALIDPENRASIALIEKLGFRLEGHQKSDTLIRGEWRDTLVYAVLESER
jgi:RimJ/RimL family protein N-acetyltransferase